MCVIIERSPEVVVPADMLDMACDINKHGYGIAYAHKSKLNFIYSIKTPNDPKEIADQLQSLRTHKVYLHLRHATVGAVVKENLHPFQSLYKKKHGLDLAFMHNGTLYDWKPKDEKDVKSDSFLFNQMFVRPLAQRFNKWSGNDVVSDLLFQRIMHREIGTMGVVVMFDSLGNSYKFNAQHGKEYEGWWASNTYSFSEYHSRSSKKPANNIWPGMPNREPWDYGSEVDPLEDVPFAVRSADKPKPTISTWEEDLKAYDAQKPVSVPDVTRKRYEFQKLGELINSKQYGDGVMQAGTLRELKILKTPFIEQAGIKSLDDVARLSESDLVEAVTNWHHAAARLIIDLLADRASLMYKNGSQAKTILDLTADKK